jgi:hypothetical protein
MARATLSGKDVVRGLAQHVKQKLTLQSETIEDGKDDRKERGSSKDSQKQVPALNEDYD